MLSVLGLIGITAYFGLLEPGEPKEGDTVLVSGAAGATGSVAAQIAKIKGCRVIGIAGGPAKVAWLLEEAHLDGAIDYKSEVVRAHIAELCPDGVDVYFDNVGGDILEAALDNLAERARVVLRGGIAGYNGEKPRPGPNNLMNLVMKRARMEGFIVIDCVRRSGEAIKQLAEWVDGGQIAVAEDMQEGPRTHRRRCSGSSRVPISANSYLESLNRRSTAETLTESRLSDAREFPPSRADVRQSDSNRTEPGGPDMAEPTRDDLNRHGEASK